MMGAAFLEIQELQLDQKEATALAQAMNEVAKQYTVSIDPKTLAWANLTMCMGTIYGTRIWAYKNRTKGQGKKQLPPNVQAIRPNAGQAPNLNTPPGAAMPTGTGDAPAGQRVTPSQLYPQGMMTGVHD